ncbi:MAG: hypothetical protein QME25_02295 [Bacteroidota bacterium]|nr:hypothetical protein [Bacteroidota bacterium]
MNYEVVENTSTFCGSMFDIHYSKPPPLAKVVYFFLPAEIAVAVSLEKIMADWN